MIEDRLGQRFGWMPDRFVENLFFRLDVVRFEPMTESFLVDSHCLTVSLRKKPTSGSTPRGRSRYARTRPRLEECTLLNNSYFMMHRSTSVKPRVLSPVLALVRAVKARPIVFRQMLTD